MRVADCVSEERGDDDDDAMVMTVSAPLDSTADEEDPSTSRLDSESSSFSGSCLDSASQ